MKKITFISFIFVLVSCGGGGPHYLDNKCEECIAELEQYQSRISNSEGPVSSSVSLSHCSEVFEFIEKYNNVHIYPMQPTSDIRNEYELAKKNEQNQ